MTSEGTIIRKTTQMTDKHGNTSTVEEIRDGENSKIIVSANTVTIDAPSE